MSIKNKNIVSVAGILGGLALLSMSNKTSQTYASDPPVPSYVPPPPSPPSPPPPPPSPPPASVTLSVGRTPIGEDQTVGASVSIDSYPYDTTNGLDVYLLYNNTNTIVANDFVHIPPPIRLPTTVNFIIPEMVFQDPTLPQNYQYMISVPIGTYTIIAQVSSYGQPAVYSNTATIIRNANGYLHDAHLLNAYRNENGNIVLSLDVNADANTYMLAQIYYVYPNYPGVAMNYRLIGGGTYTIVAPVPYEQYMKLSGVYVEVNHPGDKVITTETLKV
ncbi:MAG: hypothetical protein ACP5LZ_07870 [Fervidicoccaceae archaeon]